MRRSRIIVTAASGLLATSCACLGPSASVIAERKARHEEEQQRQQLEWEAENAFFAANAEKEKEDRLRLQRLVSRVEVLDSAQIGGRYKILGFVDSHGDDPAGALIDLRAKAARLGGNAIVDVSRSTAAVVEQSRSSGGSTAVPLLGTIVSQGSSTTTTVSSAISVWTAKVIAWTESVSPSQASAGTGFFVSSDGYIVTAEHVIKDATSVLIAVANVSFPATIVRTDPANDLAVLKVSDSSGRLPYLDIAASTDSVPLGADVFTVGFPNVALQGYTPKLTRGELNALAGIQDDPRMMQVSVEVQPGNSGGALLDARGRVVGVINSRLSTAAALAASREIPQNVNYAIKVEYLQLLLRGLALRKAPQTVLSAQVAVHERAIDATVMVIAER